MKFLMGMLALATVQAPAPQPAAADIIAEHKLPISRSGPSAYSGPGWDRLVADGRSAQFFVIGEQHGVADIALFVKAMHAELAKVGYTHSAQEIGPYSTEFAASLVRSRPGALKAYVAQPGHGFALPFLFFEEEIALAEQQVALSPDKENALWGLDQEFVGAAPIAAERLRARARTARQKQAVEAFAARSKGDPFFIGKLAAADLDPLQAAFGGDREASGLIDALRLSSDIYRPFFNKGVIYPANLERENYMKRNFVRQFEAAEKRLGKPPKVFMKIGGNHAMRGFTGTNVPGLGNFLAEWGLPRGFALVNMMVDCSGGEMLDPASGKPGPCQPYFGKDSLMGKLATDDLTLIDLRPLRSKLGQLKEADEKTRQLILSFDYYLAIRNVKAATSAGEGIGKAAD